MISKIRNLAFFGMIVMLVTACAVTQPQSSGPVTYHADANVRHATGDLVININRTADGYLETVMLDGFGAGQGRTPVEWSIVWYESSGQRVSGISDRYRRMTISPSIPFQISATAPVRDASRAHIHVRRSLTAD